MEHPGEERRSGCEEKGLEEKVFHYQVSEGYGKENAGHRKCNCGLVSTLLGYK